MKCVCQLFFSTRVIEAVLTMVIDIWVNWEQWVEGNHLVALFLVCVHAPTNNSSEKRSWTLTFLLPLLLWRWWCCLPPSRRIYSKEGISLPTIYTGRSAISFIFLLNSVVLWYLSQLGRPVIAIAAQNSTTTSTATLSLSLRYGCLSRTQQQHFLSSLRFTFLVDDCGAAVILWH